MRDDNEIREQERRALRYLSEQLGVRAPDYLTLEGEFHEAPLEGEGRTFVFSFPLEPGPGVDRAACSALDRKHYVAVGRTEPNFFPAYGMHTDDAYSYHVGTRFMLEMGVRIVDPNDEPPTARPALRQVVANYARGAEVRQEDLAALFRCEQAYFAVYRLRLGEEDVYCLGADCPPGFYRLTQHPPQMVLRLHLGKAIRNEAREQTARSERPRQGRGRGAAPVNETHPNVEPDAGSEPHA
jgi:hypothetical protein